MDCTTVIFLFLFFAFVAYEKKKVPTVLIQCLQFLANIFTAGFCLYCVRFTEIRSDKKKRKYIVLTGSLKAEVIMK